MLIQGSSLLWDKRFVELDYPLDGMKEYYPYGTGMLATKTCATSKNLV